ncbi:M48 family metallopeptidase [Roseateles cellulosilyticus]|uniref:M48 family metalloprotease n=1 Tax=Pelomonas cellulosilytica TaxID=2906762 RepID=A0ABS8XVV2_9BURK|nr:M48 family metallopeptidase [Pelomonas sp. P8]MCE4554766.1 M48 family metalloprotease [Pelomonas sp. P8]
MRRRAFIGCAQCLALSSLLGAAPARAQGDWLAPPRFEKPDLGTDEGGLWAMMDREETRLRRSPFLLRDAGLQKYLQDIACKLSGDHCPDVRVYPVRTPFFNASMAPNGMMQVWSGLLLRVDNEAQLAAVLGHEIGHYMQRHTLERLRDVKSRSAFGMFLGMFGLVGLVGQMAALAGAFGFSRDQERQADQIGLTLMRRAGYDTREAAKVWENLMLELAAVHGGDPSQRNPLFATHPGSAERSATLRDLSAADSEGRLGEEEHRRALAGLQQTMLEDELKRGQTGETLALLNRLIERQPARADLLYTRGEARRLRAGNDDLDQAQADFERAIALGTEPAEAHRALGYLHRSRERHDLAREAFGRYIDKAPAAPDAALIKSLL